MLMSAAAPRPAWGLPAWELERAEPLEALACAGCEAPLELAATCPGCRALVCSPACARRVHGGVVSCAWDDRPAYPGEPASADGTPWPCDACGGELPPAAWSPVAEAAGMPWHACNATCCAAIVGRLAGGA